MTNEEVMSWPQVCDRELDRLHKLIEQGKEVGWATAEASRIMRLISEPVYIPASSGLKATK